MVTVEQLAAKYPLLWHMADVRNTDGILQRGLLSTSALLDLLEIDRNERKRYERERRPDDTVLESDEHGTIVLRDQRPLNIARLEGALTSGTTRNFLAFINRRVFFWPTIERLKTMNGARAYQDRTQLVFVLRSAGLLAEYEPSIRLSRINSGATMPYAAPRSVATFQTLREYDWSSGKRSVAEVTIESGVPDIWTFVERLELWRNAEMISILAPPYDDRLRNRMRV